jgi:hypothetical protein
MSVVIVFIGRCSAVRGQRGQRLIVLMDHGASVNMREARARIMEEFDSSGAVFFSEIGGMNLSDWANLATITTAVAAVFAITFAFWQTRQFRNHQLETMALDQYQNFLALCVKYPEFAPPPDGSLDIKALTYNGSVKSFIQYEWFFTVGENALESIFLSVGERGVWKQTISNVLTEHAEYIKSERYTHIYRPTVEPEFQAFIDQEIGRFSR